MKALCHRRDFLKSALTATASLAVPVPWARADTRTAFSFIALGDLHYDRLGLHDMGFLQANYPSDISQIQNYSRITASIMPRLFAAVRNTIADLNAQGQYPVAFVLQLGDLVEGLCGSEQLATQQSREVLALVRNAKLGAPFFFCKGNHDITGPGATNAVQNVYLPFLRQQTAAFKWGGAMQRPYYSVEYGNSLFCVYDSYDTNSLAWLQSTLAGRTAQNCFVIMHEPVVPYGARANWIVFYGSDSTNTANRAQLLSLLGRQNAYVLGGHIHKFNTLVRQTSTSGRFSQLGIGSVVDPINLQPKAILCGVQYYDCADQLATEPSFDPASYQQRCNLYSAEAPYVTQFEYANMMGYAVVRVNGSTVEADVYSGASRKIWQSIPLSQNLFS
jgi:Calcineurin-like phosphoesterase